MTIIYIRPTYEQLLYCVENFGIKYAHYLIYYRNENYACSSSRWSYDEQHFYFQNEEDAVLFKLVWL